ncbi:MAG: prepilin-type N-terminal cleavage/methylation domain-containing protein [Candidatus Omnitrophica bacterium]|nr:prepilin-type N-terminal cleavage/methylation domain-containing protein [Candidatus Omnitrophota bacterium]
MNVTFKKSLAQKADGFTLIELIIVVVIIGILALVAIPRYFANVAKAQKAQVYSNLDAIRQAQLAYYAAYGVYASSLPITVILDGETIISVADPSNTGWRYYVSSAADITHCPSRQTQGAYKLPGDICYYSFCITGVAYASCTP